MGILSFLFGKKNAPKPLNTPEGNKNRKTSSLAVAVQETLCHIVMLRQSDIDEIINMLSGQYTYKELYEKYFIDREWSWPLLEEWRDTLIKRGAYWSSCWFPDPDNEDTFFDKAVSKLNVADIRSILKQVGVKVGSKAKREDIVELLEQNVSMGWLEQNSEKWNNAALEVKEAEEEFKRYGFKYEEFCMLISHIRTYAKNLEDLQKFKELGASYSLMFLCGGATGMKVLAEELHKENPEAIPPLFPDDRTVLRIDLSSMK